MFIGHSPPTAISFILENFFIETPQNSEHFIYKDTFVNTSIFKHFVNDALGWSEDRVLQEVQKQVLNKWPGNIQKRSRNHLNKAAFHLMPIYGHAHGQMIVGPYLVPSVKSSDEITSYPSGSKMVFSRMGGMYCHTGILLAVQDPTKFCVLEIQKIGTGKIALAMNDLGDVLRNNKIEKISINNMFLAKVPGPNFYESFVYRLSRLIGIPIAYNASRLNCDVIATYLLTGHTQWTTLTPCCEKVYDKMPLSLPVPVFPGKEKIRKNNLKGIEESADLEKTPVRKSILCSCKT